MDQRWAYLGTVDHDLHSAGEHLLSKRGGLARQATNAIYTDLVNTPPANRRADNQAGVLTDKLGIRQLKYCVAEFLIRGIHHPLRPDMSRVTWSPAQKAQRRKLAKSTGHAQPAIQEHDGENAKMDVPLALIFVTGVPSTTGNSML